jgi:aspartyl-tRNA(Asn)/glutamyl-tRNA(Gln) amidotransferase subunit C
MVINDELISKLEGLSKLKLSDSEKAVLKSELASIIQMFDKIGEVDTAGISPLIHMTDTVNIMREDIGTNPLAREQALKNAPVSIGPYFAVPKVIE